MIATAVAAFLGAFSALVVMAELAGIPNRWIRYLAAFLVGIVVTILLAALLAWVVSAFGRIG